MAQACIEEWDMGERGWVNLGWMGNTKHGFIHFDDPRPDEGAASQSDSEMYSKSSRTQHFDLSPSPGARAYERSCSKFGLTRKLGRMLI